MFITFKKWTALYVVVLLVLFAVFAAVLWQGSAINASKNLELAQEMVLVIDPGHGGFDPGAVASDGTAESRLNLEIALQLEELAQFLGVQTDMTRREDVSTESDETAAVRQRKNSDLQNRVEQINAITNGVLVSLHQNSLPQVPSVHGAQVFYGGAEGSQAMAETVQAALNTTVNDRAKECKAAGGGVYLLKNAKIPAILVECGFLSNADETALLNTQEHQNRLALTVLASVLEHLR
jgi:N-acetylmuramoyl-L-alanine amidase